MAFSRPGSPPRRRPSSSTAARSAPDSSAPSPPSSPTSPSASPRSSPLDAKVGASSRSSSSSLLLVVASVVEFGTSAWVAFGRASAFAARNLAEGTYPLARFSSVYAAAFGAGLRGPTAMGVHLAVLAVVTVSSLLVGRLTTDRRAVVAVALTWSTFVSPYAYDYDMALLVVVAALLSDASVRVLGREASANLLAAVLLVQFAGFVWWTFNGTGGVTAYVLVALFVVVIRVVDRDRSQVAVDAPVDAGRAPTTPA